MITLNNLVNTGQRLEQEKNTKISMKDNEQKTVHSSLLQEQLKKKQKNKNKKRTIKAEIDTKNFLSKFGKQKCVVTNKQILKDNLSTWCGVISVTDEQFFDKYCSLI